MSDDNKNEKVESADPARREALIKIGKYAAYTAPAMMVTVGTAREAGAVPTSTPGMTVAKLRSCIHLEQIASKLVVLHFALPTTTPIVFPRVPAGSASLFLHCGSFCCLSCVLVSLDAL